MGSTSFLNKSKSSGYKNKSGSSIASDKDMNGKLRRQKIRRPSKMNEYGLKRIPDYTELAYKEAVGKLRYFLSGNYAPSVRSYGSQSIKNLDESDGDIDKKYSFTTLAEFKPRPRLTAKYATLYADSLNNAAQTKVNTATPPAADVSGGTNPDVVNFIQKQEEYIEQLERESQYCRDELNNLLGKVKEVISENENLHEAQKNKLISRMFHSYNAGSETDELDDLGDSTGLDSDNKMTPSKSRRSTAGRSSRLEGPNIVFESRISELEAQLAQAKIDFKKVQEENNENKRKLASGLVDSTCLDGFKRQIDNLQRDKSSLEAQIAKLKLNLEHKDLGDLEGRYKRSDVEIQLREERNNLEAEIRRLKDDLAKERSKVRELAGEGARRAIQERSAAEQRYNSHCDDLQRDLAAQYDTIAKLQLELDRQRRDENDLKRELSMKNAAIEELKMELKNKTASLQADLAQAHAEKASLEEELAGARLAAERLTRQARGEQNRLNSEIQSLRQRLDRADADVVHARRENLRLAEQVANLEKEINLKNLTPISPEKKKKEKEISSMLESMDNKHAKTVAELESMIHSQNSLMEKLTGECRLLTDKLDDANRRHKEQLATLHRQVEYLTVSLQSTHAPTAYEAPSPHETSTDRTIPEYATTGRDYTGSDATGYTEIGHEPVSDIRENGRHRDDHVPSRRVSKQDSRTSLLSQDQNKTMDPQNVNSNNLENERIPQSFENSKHENDYTQKEYSKNDVTEKHPFANTEYTTNTQEYVPPNYGEQEYEHNITDSQYQEHPNYEETPVSESDYQDQNYEQRAYTTDQQHSTQQQQDYPQSESGYTQETLEYTQEQSGYTQEQPEYTQEQADYTEEQSAYNQQQPSYDQQPGYDQEQPGYDQQQSGYDQQQSGYNQEQTGYDQEQPVANQEQYEQYTDPNAQNYAKDQKFKGDPGYNQAQYHRYDQNVTNSKEEQKTTQRVENDSKSNTRPLKQAPNQHEESKVSRNGNIVPPKGKAPGKR